MTKTSEKVEKRLKKVEKVEKKLRACLNFRQLEWFPHLPTQHLKHNSRLHQKDETQLKLIQTLLSMAISCPPCSRILCYILDRPLRACWRNCHTTWSKALLQSDTGIGLFIGHPKFLFWPLQLVLLGTYIWPL